MLSSQSKPTDTAGIGKQVQTAIQSKWEQGDECEQIFQLIDSLLSFEACLYHQILPFELKDNSLLLGMVHPQDSEALDYVTRILSYVNCTMVIEAIATDVHRRILSAYLNHKNTSQPDAKPEHQPIANLTAKNHPITVTENKIVSADPDFESYQQASLITPQSHQHSWQRVDLPPMPITENLSKTTNSSFFTLENSRKDENPAEVAPADHLPILPAQVPERFTPINELQTLKPRKLLEELLGRVLAGGIGRLYLERQPYEGRILWSDNGVLQSVLDKLPLSVFQGVLNELKRFVDLPVTTIAEPKQVEKECVYQENRLLVRLRVMPGIYGEEATLQVLRGAALKFYQQQQLTRLSRDALGIAQQLSFKLHELQERLLLNPSVNTQQLEALVTLNQLVDNLDQQIKILSLSNDSLTNSKL